MSRIGPKMALALQIIANNPGCSIKYVAEQVGPHGSLKYGYAVVHRCIKVGLVGYSKANGRYRLAIPAQEAA